MTKTNESVRDALTAQQREAAADSRKRVCVVAGAGCGKTRVLVEHFISLIERGRRADSIVAITFTEKAAAEMTERLRERCERKAREATDKETRALWREAYWAVQSGAVSTIHALASRILGDFPFAAGLDPRFTVLDGNAAEMLLEAAFSDYARRCMERNDAVFGDLLTAHTTDTIRSTVMRMLSQRAVFRKLRENALAPEDGFVERAFAALRAWARRRAAAILCRDEMLAAFETLAELSARRPWKRDAEVADEMARVVVTIASLWPGIREELDCRDPTRPIRPFHPEDLTRPPINRGNKNNWTSEDDLKKARAAYKQVKDDFFNVLGDILREPGEAEREQLERTRRFVRVAAGVFERYKALKSERAAVDFDDQVETALRLLVGDDEVRSAVHARIRCILVDELQDISPVQWEFIQALVGDRRDAHLFLAGDEKQSIYRFRQADVKVFRDVRSAMEGEGSVRTLSLSFRFHPKLNEFYNFLFARLMAPQDEEPFRTPFRALETHRRDVPETAAVEFLVARLEEGQNMHEGREAEARMVAARILKMMADGAPAVLDRATGERRAPTFSDMAILVRATSDLGIYERALREAGIEYYVFSSSSFYETQVVTDIYNLARTLANPSDEPALCAVLRGPFCSLSDNALAVLTAKRSPAEGFADRGEFARLLEPAEAERLADAALLLERLREDYGRVMLAELIERAIEWTGYDAYLLGTFMGRQHLANALKLIAAIRKLESDGFTAAETLERLKNIMSSPPRESEAVVVDPESNHVQVMTIHKAKGLEFPIVFIPDIGRRRSGSREAQLSAEIGIEPPAKRLATDKSHTLIDKYISYYEDEQDAEESKRLLYVASTRARDHLVFSCAKPFGRASGEWLGWLDEHLGFLDAEHGSQLPYGGYSAKVIREIPDATPLITFHHLNDELLSSIADGSAQKHAGGPPDALRRRVEPASAPAADGAHFSVSELVDYMKCPLCYRLKHVAALKHPPSPKLLREPPGPGRGEAFHKFFELLSRGAEPREAARTACEMTRSDPSTGKHLLLHMLNVRDALDANGLLEGIPADEGDRPELAFTVPVGDKLLAGKFDLFRLRDGTARVIDYKTHDVSSAEIEKAVVPFLPQLRLYALAAFKLYPQIESVETATIFTEAFARHEKVYARDELPELEAEALSAMEAIEAARFDPARHCPACEFAGNLCKAGRRP